MSGVGDRDRAEPQPNRLLRLDPARVRPAGPWRRAEVFDRLGSTNDEVAARPRLWRVVVAERQDAGRGRLGRPWSTTPGTALAVSVLVPVPRCGAAWVPLFAGLAARRAVAAVAGVPASLKWPNDLLVPDDGDRKVAGLLATWHPDGVVVGLGVNVDTDRADLPLDTATSLRAAGAPGVDRADLLTSWLTHLAALLDGDTGPAGPSSSAYRAACATVGRVVEVHLPAAPVLRGTATGVDAEGRLVLRSRDGTTTALAAGDVVHVRPGGGG
ncbi:MAG: biotin--[acetyl-CoA-carboxylase] ligase [Dermatophilaceae bacterium]